MAQTENTTTIEQLIEAVLNSRFSIGSEAAVLQSMAAEVHNFNCAEKRVVLLGGGTGLSTVVGGNSQLAQWADNPNTGLKQIFPKIDVIVCTTDDGRSTGRLLKQLPMIGIGDIRKLCLSMIVPARLEETYNINSTQRRQLIRLIHTIFNHRFDDTALKAPEIADPLLAASSELSNECPAALKKQLRELGTFLAKARNMPRIKPAGHCLGNLLLTASIFMAADGCSNKPPSLLAIRKGINRIVSAIGAPPGSLHPATAAPGQLVFKYANGVATHGQSKTSTARRGFPIEQVYIEFYKKPSINAHAIRALQAADIIILAPGSLYTSSIPVLLVPAIAEAIRNNHSALKILAANFWVEEGETDITHTGEPRGYRVSELLDAYDFNIPGGRNDLFHCVLSANLENIPSSILRNYALEGKRPLYLDRKQVKCMHIKPIESSISSVEFLQSTGRIYHDSQKFALAVRTLLFAHSKEPVKSADTPVVSLTSTPPAARPVLRGKQLLCDYWTSINAVLDTCKFENEILRENFIKLIWKNRDIQIEHVSRFSTIRIINARDWNRSTAWDNVLGYYDPEENSCKFHSQLLKKPARLSSDMLIVLGESLLGRYIQEPAWTQPDDTHAWGSRCFEIKLLDPAQRTCLLSPERLHEYLILSRMVPHPSQTGIYRITLNNNDGFIPPGLLFGLMYAWYLDNTYVPVMENEMSILHLEEKTLIPHQVQEFKRKKALVDFFRKHVFSNDV